MSAANIWKKRHLDRVAAVPRHHMRLSWLELEVLQHVGGGMYTPTRREGLLCEFVNQRRQVHDKWMALQRDAFKMQLSGRYINHTPPDFSVPCERCASGYNLLQRFVNASKPMLPVRAFPLPSLGKI